MCGDGRDVHWDAREELFLVERARAERGARLRATFGQRSDRHAGCTDQSASVRRILAASLAHPTAVLVVTLVFAVAGAAAFWRLPIEAFPELADPQVQVITLFNGHAAEEVERQVTLPVEREMNGIPNLTRMHSFSLFGLSFVVLTFDDGTDLYFARQQVIERLAQVDLPDGVKATLGPLATPTGEIYRYTLRGDAYSPMQLREVEDWVMERHLKQVPGVADVVSYGGFVKQYQVEVDQRRLEARGVTLRQVFEALGRSNANAGGNYIVHGDQQYVVRGLGTLASVDDVGKVVVAARGGTPIRVADVARVTIGAAPRRGIVTRDHDREAVEGIVLMRRGENPSEVLAALDAKVEQLNHGILPPGMRVDVFYDRGRLVRRTLTTVSHNLVVGAVLVVLVVGVFLMSLRAALIVAVVIPLSLLAASNTAERASRGSRTRPRRRARCSTMMTAPSTMMPKSTATMLSRLALMPRACR